MWFYRGIAGAVLVTCLVACAGDEATKQGRQVLQDEGVQQDVVAGKAAAPEGPDPVAAAPGTGEGPDTPAPEPEPVIELPPTLDLRLPRDSKAGSDDLLLPAPASPLLPDLFGQEKGRRRTTVSGELFLGDGEDEQKRFDMQRIQGGQIDIEVSLD